MDGFITTRDLVLHAGTIVNEFGARCLLRCFWRVATTSERVTFLQCAVDLRGRVPPAAKA